MGDIPYFLRILGHFVHFFTKPYPFNASKGCKSSRFNMNLIRSDRFQTKMFMNSWIIVHFGHVSAINGGGLYCQAPDRFDGRLPPKPNRDPIRRSKKSYIRNIQMKNPSCRKISVFSFKEIERSLLLEDF